MAMARFKRHEPLVVLFDFDDALHRKKK